MPVIVPLWFYEFGSVMYFFAALIGLLLSFFSFKLYKFTKKRQHLLLNLSFVLITIGFIILTASNVFSFLHFEKCQPSCTITNEHIFRGIVYGNYGYYAMSLTGYFILFLSYLLYNEKKGKKFLLQVAPIIPMNILFQSPQTFVLFPFENVLFQPFHLISAALLFLIIFFIWKNYKKSKTRLSLLVPIGFISILIYHVLMYSLPFFPLFFAFAHLSLLIGFGALLFMLVKVTRR